MSEPLTSRLLIAERHVRILGRCLESLEPDRPIGVDRIRAEDEDLLRKLDQFQSRFTKLQDHLGSAVFPAVLHALGENLRPMAFLDRLDRLEGLDLIPSASVWLELRAVRNRLAHDYPENPAELAEELEASLGSGERLLGFWSHLRKRIALHPRLAQMDPSC